MTEQPIFRLLGEAVGFANPGQNPTNIQIIGPARWPRLMSRTVLGEYLCISGATVDSWVKLGILPPPSNKTVGRSNRWDKHEVDAVLDNTTPNALLNGKSFDALITVRKSKSA